MIRADGYGVITIKPDFNKVVSSAKVMLNLILFVTEYNNKGSEMLISEPLSNNAV